MKNKIVTIILGIALLLSVGGNIYLVKTMTDTKGEVNALSNQLVTADNQIADLQEQLTDLTALQEQVDDLQAQLAESREQIENLESTIAENNTTIANLEEQLAQQEQAQTANSQRNSSASTSGGNGSNGGNGGGGRVTDPGYQGERDGFIYTPGVGYVPRQGDPDAGMHENEWAPSEDELSGEKIGSM